MFGGISNFLRRHRRKILVAGGLVTAGIFLKRYATQKFLEWEAKQTQAYLEQLKRHHHFEGTLQTCDSTALSLSSKLREAVVRHLDVETLLMELKNNPPNKLELWEEIKVLVFAHAIGEVVCECLLVVYLRVQLSILGGYMYVDSQKHREAGNGLYKASTAVQQRYLGQINHFFQVGQERVLKAVLAIVRSVLGPISLKSLLRLRDFELELSSIKARLFTSEIFQANFLAHCFLSPEVVQQSEDAVEKPSQSSDFVVRKMVQETKDVLESEDFEKVVISCMDRGMARILDMLSECYLCIQPGFANPNNVAVALAKLLPTLRACMLRQSPSDLGSYMHQLLQLESLNNFSANIYEAFSQEIPSLKS